MGRLRLPELTEPRDKNQSVCEPSMYAKPKTFVNSSPRQRPG